MDIRDKGIQTQIKGIEELSGMAFPDLRQEVLAWGDLSHAQARERAQSRWGLSLMYAETLILCARAKDQSVDEAAAEWYSGPRQVFLPLHQKLMNEVGAWEGVEAVPKKTYLSLKVKKQFATWGPATNTRFEIGLNGKHLQGSSRLVALPPGGICHFKVVVNSQDDIDSEVLSWLKSAWEAAR